MSKQLICVFTRGDGIEDRLLVEDEADAERQIRKELIVRYERRPEIAA